VHEQELGFGLPDAAVDGLRRQGAERALQALLDDCKGSTSRTGSRRRTSQWPTRSQSVASRCDEGA
jgi:hypothetical protein